MNRLVITGLVEELKEGIQSGKYQYQISNLGIAAMQVAVLSQTQQDANARGSQWNQSCIQCISG